MQIPFTNLNGQYKSIKKQIDLVLLNTVRNFEFIKGKEVLEFQNQFSKLLGTPHCVTTGNGTDSIFISLKALGIKSGDEVITSAFSWISSSETISLCGASPVFVDIDPHSYTINPLLIEEKITTRTKAIIVVHLYGQAAHISRIKEICKKNNLFLIEDCAQAHLTKESGKYVGTFGDVGCFSFYPTKNLGAYGDGGCILATGRSLAEKLTRTANHGALEKDDHLIEGLNSRMDTLQAAILLTKLPYLKQWNEKRLKNAVLYNTLLKDTENIVIPFIRPDTNHSFHIYAIRSKRRNDLKHFLLKNGIQTIVHYPTALPNLPAYRHLDLRAEDFPVASALQDEILSLPIYPELNQKEISYICRIIKRFYQN